MTEKVSLEEGSPSVAAVVGKPNTVTEDDKERINVLINSKGLVTTKTRMEQAIKGINSRNIKIPDFPLPKKRELILIENDGLSTLIEINEGINSSSISRHPTTFDLEKMVEPKKLAETARSKVEFLDVKELLSWLIVEGKSLELFAYMAWMGWNQSNKTRLNLQAASLHQVVE